MCCRARRSPIDGAADTEAATQEAAWLRVAARRTIASDFLAATPLSHLTLTAHQFNY